jgi:hypothetical protein
VDVELGCRYPRTCVLGNVQPSLRDWSCSEPLPSTACWAKFSRPRSTSSGQALRDWFQYCPGLPLVPYGLSIAAVRENQFGQDCFQTE